jgi:shikimate dehydrogenase
MTAGRLPGTGPQGTGPQGTEPQGTGPQGAGPQGAGLLDAVTRRFAADEMLTPAGRPERLNVAAAGTLAEGTVGNPLLDAACQAAGIRIGGRTAHADLDALLADLDWDLALIVSPHKGQAAQWCDRLAPRAAATGVVDTLVRAGGEVAGYNTNSHAWAAAAARLMGSDVPARILVVGSGATARSVTFAALRAFPRARVGVAARSRAAAAALVSDHAGSEYVPDPGGFAPDLVAHVTTAGEQDDEQPLDVPLGGALQPGTRVFDLTNRLSALQRHALAAGCVVMSGNLMQLLTNTLRAALAGAGQRPADRPGRGPVSGHLDRRHDHPLRSIWIQDP